MTKKKVALMYLVLAIILLAAVLLALTLGSARLSLNQILSSISGGGDFTSNLILFDLRLPRVVAALLAGAGLAVAGLLLQSVTGNDLCSPNIIGVNSGAGFAVMVFLCIFPMAHRALPAAAFIGAFATTLIVLSVSLFMHSSNSKTTVILAGVAIGTFLSSGISFLSQLYPDVLPSYTSFSIGSFSGIYAEDLTIPAIIIAVGLVASQMLSQKLNILCLGEEIAYSLGVQVKSLRIITLAVASALCASVVSFAGLLGFVGLVVPHIARKIAGHDIRILVSVCALCGAILVTLSDLIGRTMFSPADLPAGIIVSAVGAPFFIYLLFRRDKTYD